MGLYSEHVLPRLVDLACGGSSMDRWRRRAVEGLYGTVVEVGFGSGANLPHLPAAVTRLYAVEPSEVARRRSHRRARHDQLSVEHVGIDGARLPLPDDSCDGALSTFALCTIPDVDAALAELRRVLRPGGRLHFLEHGLSPDPAVQRWQHRFEPMQRCVAGGCHLTRDAASLATDAGFEVEWLDQRDVAGPAPWTWFSLGVAVSPG